MKRYALLLLPLLIVACNRRPSHTEVVQDLPPIVPDYAGVCVPSDIAPLNFGAPSEYDFVDVIVRGRQGGELHSNGRYADFDAEEWGALLHQNRGDSLTVSVCLRLDGHWFQYQPFSIHVSSDSLSAWGITYRLIPPGYESFGSMGIYQRDLSSFEETPIIENRLIETNCVNCHTSNSVSGADFTFHVRGSHGATVVGHDGSFDIFAPRNEELGGGLVYPYWHPSGRFIAYSTNHTHQLFHQLAGRRVEVYDDTSDIVLFDTQTHQLLRDSLLATDSHLENYPSFSPDGRWLYYCTAAKVDSVWQNYRDVRYSVCRIPFDAAAGRFGTVVDTLVNARLTQASANHLRVSPDGNYLLYVRSDYGCFPIWHPEADIWIMDLRSLESRPMTEINSSRAESFPRWSPDGRWILFTTRRNDGLYTQVYLAHVDSSGRASKPFCLPQKKPMEYSAETIYSFNTPDFVNAPVRVSQRELARRLMAPERQKMSLRTIP